MKAVSADESDPEFRAKLLHAFARLTPEELKRIDAVWKSNMDKKVDRLVAFADKYEEYLRLCLERERRKRKISDAVIEKSLVGAIYVILGVLCIALWDYVIEHIRAALGGLVK